MIHSNSAAHESTRDSDTISERKSKYINVITDIIGLTI